MTLDYHAYDADNHLYEPIDSFTRHLPDRSARLSYHAEVQVGCTLISRQQFSFTFFREWYAVRIFRGEGEGEEEGTGAQGPQDRLTTPR